MLHGLEPQTFSNTSCDTKYGIGTKLSVTRLQKEIYIHNHHIAAPHTRELKTKNRSPHTPQECVTSGLSGLKPLFVPRGGLEPPRPCEHWHLKPARLPIPPPGQVVKQ